MAITGSGTQADPFVVHSYDEIKSVYADTSLTASTLYYVVLANNINCNDYGVDFTWDSITGSNWIDFDLDGHTIKNIAISNGQYLFNLTVNCGVNVTPRPKIHNGSIRNVFGNSGGIFKNAGAYSPITLENLSISINGTSCTDYIFWSFYVNMCAIYIQSSKLNQTFFGVSLNSHTVWLENSDVLFDISDLNGKPLFINTNGNSNAYQLIISNCRFRGKVGGLPYAYGMLWNVYQRTMFNNTKIKVEKCCISIDSTECNLDGGTGTGVLISVSENMANLNNVVNKTIMDSTYTANHDYDISDEDIVNGDALRSAGFTVVNVVGG